LVKLFDSNFKSFSCLVLWRFFGDFLVRLWGEFAGAAAPQTALRAFRPRFRFQRPTWFTSNLAPGDLDVRPPGRLLDLSAQPADGLAHSGNKPLASHIPSKSYRPCPKTVSCQGPRKVAHRS